MRRFNLYSRNGIYYVRFWDETSGSYTTGKSTGEKDQKSAYAAVYHLLEYGELPGRKISVEDALQKHQVLKSISTMDLDAQSVQRMLSVLKERGLILHAITPDSTESGSAVEHLEQPLQRFLCWFWDYDNSEYVAEKLRHGHSIGRTHCQERSRLVRTYWAPWLEMHPTMLGQVSRATIDAFSREIGTKALSAQTKNHILKAATVPLRWAYRHEILGSDPTIGIAYYTGHRKKRDILSVEEAAKLLRMDWIHGAAKLASLVAATTGLRAGEIAGLQHWDIQDGFLQVRHSWSRSSELKTTKTNTERYVPLIPAVQDQLTQFARSNPHGGPFVFWSAEADRPLSTRRFYEGFRDALAMLSGMRPEDVHSAHRAERLVREGKRPTEHEKRMLAALTETREFWQARGVSFHSWRHFYTATLADRVGQRLMIATGHKTPAVFDAYADHLKSEHLAEISLAVRSAFNQLT